MAYVGSTAASSVANPPVNLVRGIGNQQNAAIIGSNGPLGGNGLWYYSSTDASSSISGTVTYFTDGLQLGMRTGDLCMVAQASSVGSTTVLLGMGILGTTNSTAGYSLMTGSILLSTV